MPPSKGHAVAQWKLGRMYAEGDGVPQNDLRAFEYFSRIADSHADDSPDLPQARFVANAFVPLGHYYLDGIPKSTVKADPDRAREMYSYAASYFGDADAQYSLARLYLDGVGAPQGSAAGGALAHACRRNKGQYQAQAMLGAYAFQGRAGAAPGGARPDVADACARQRRGRASKTPTSGSSNCTTPPPSRRPMTSAQLALVYLERWLKGRRRLR